MKPQFKSIGLLVIKILEIGWVGFPGISGHIPIVLVYSRNCYESIQRVLKDQYHFEAIWK